MENHRLSRIRDRLACPVCRAALQDAPGALQCTSCGKAYPIRADKLYFIEPLTAKSESFLIETLKRVLGNWLYRYVLPIIGPTFPFSFRRAIRRFADPKREIVVDIGCGNHRVDDDVIALDGMDYPCVDIVCNVTALPFKDDAVDLIASRSLLEHVHPFDRAVAEMRRCTAPGGRNLHLIPFLYPFHSSPEDYQRLTHAGAARAFDGWETLEQRHVFGPFTLLVVVASETLAIAASFRSERLRGILRLVFAAILSPVKFLDAPFVWSQAFMTVAPSILTVSRKPATGG